MSAPLISKDLPKLVTYPLLFMSNCEYNALTIVHPKILLSIPKYFQPPTTPSEANGSDHITRKIEYDMLYEYTYRVRNM